MALLGIGKKQENASADSSAQREVPDELPDLPQAAENAPDGQQAAEGAVPDELPPIDASGMPDAPEMLGELAPDELPPIGDGNVLPGADGVDGYGRMPAKGSDRRLYFSSMLQKLHEEGLKSTKLSAPSVNLLTDMKKHWKNQKKNQEMDEMKRRVAESLTPLQRLEQEWVALQEDIEQKKRQLYEKEEQIRKLADEAKNLALKAEKMKVD